MERTPPIARLFAITIVSLSVVSVAVSGGAQSGVGGELRPQIVVADTASGCPSVAGAFVALLDPARGMLLLSAAPFPGGHVVGDARSTEMTVSIPGAAGWTLDRVGSGQGQVPLWGAHYPFLAATGRGCVGFDKQRWSSEGDLVTYLRWLVEEIYLQLPTEERQRRPDFRLSERQVSIIVERPGYGAFHLAGKEGATLACRYSDAARIYLMMPFVLDESTGRLAVKISYTDGEYFDTSEKKPLGWVVASTDDPGSLSEPPLTITVEEVFPSEN